MVRFDRILRIDLYTTCDEPFSIVVSDGDHSNRVMDGSSDERYLLHLAVLTLSILGPDIASLAIPLWLRFGPIGATSGLLRAGGRCRLGGAARSIRRAPCSCGILLSW